MPPELLDGAGGIWPPSGSMLSGQILTPAFITVPLSYLQNVPWLLEY